MNSGMRLPEEQLRYMSREEMSALVRRLEGEKARLQGEQDHMMRDINQRLTHHLTEIRDMKDLNKKLQEENQELRDLCCYLDDDRKRCGKAIREWQRFGRYASHTMGAEVGAYQTKLTDLEMQQDGIAKENLELQELCLYLDEERSQSSSSGSEQAPALTAQLQQRIDRLEKEKQDMLQKSNTSPAATDRNSRAFQLLNVHEGLYQPREGPMQPQEKAVVQALCKAARKSVQMEPQPNRESPRFNSPPPTGSPRYNGPPSANQQQRYSGQPANQTARYNGPSFNQPSRYNRQPSSNQQLRPKSPQSATQPPRQPPRYTESEDTDMWYLW